MEQSYRDRYAYLGYSNWLGVNNWVQNMETPRPSKGMGRFLKGEIKIRWVENQGLILEAKPIKIAIAIRNY